MVQAFAARKPWTRAVLKPCTRAVALRDGRDWDRSLRWVAAAQAPVGPIPLVLRYCDWHQRCGALPELDFQKQVGRSKVGWCWHQVLGVPAALENLLPGLEMVLHVEPNWGRVALHKGKAPKALHKGKRARTVSIKKSAAWRGGWSGLACLFFWCFCELLLATSAFAIALMAQIPVFTSFSPGQGQSLEQGQSPEQEQYDEACEKKS